ncbi:hypothetical protein P692DRAFT_20828486, partial [Suillus brevipes Sb2]
KTGSKHCACYRSSLPPPSISQPRPPKLKRVQLHISNNDDDVPSTLQPLPPPPLSQEYQFYCRCCSRVQGDLRKEIEVAIPSR